MPPAAARRLGGGSGLTTGTAAVTPGTSAVTAISAGCRRRGTVMVGVEVVTGPLPSVGRQVCLPSERQTCLLDAAPGDRRVDSAVYQTREGHRPCQRSPGTTPP
ncbi:hypothetical protein FRACA_1120012 [Frankia canadensis]|uniref:Uncharacterized protein n=1 Tax=Frankia canadensis TaxID=1836972 RepID=A0A2I2KJG7_9ACTN|nr:hypothetical protein FRACA_1120012 [Frankia canadensis]SOU53084.1 hypothetical protein FRACA_1120012 [Frankia canadensis]